MSSQHPITPPDELVDKWYDEWLNADELLHLEQAIATQAARWGADQELEACVQLTRDNDGYDAALGLRATRRPKPPSLKEQALDALSEAESSGCLYVNGRSNLIRRALEALPND